MEIMSECFMWVLLQSNGTMSQRTYNFLCKVAWPSNQNYLRILVLNLLSRKYRPGMSYIESPHPDIRDMTRHKTSCCSGGGGELPFVLNTLTDEHTGQAHIILYNK